MEKAWGEGDATDTKLERWQRCYQGYLVCLVAWQPRLHVRLRIRSMNKGGRLGPMDSQVNADTGCKGQASGATPCGKLLVSAPLTIGRSPGRCQLIRHSSHLSCLWGSGSCAPRNSLQFHRKGGCNQTWQQIPARPLVNLTTLRNLR